MKFENECWDHFKGETWKREINVRDFIQSNYTPYEGDDSFLVASSEKTRKVWNKLTENQQAAVMEAAADTQAFNADLSETAENKVLDELKSSGCNVVDVPDKTPWQEACAKVISENTSDQAELYQQLLDMKA